MANIETESIRAATGDELRQLVSQANRHIDSLVTIKANLLALRTTMQDSVNAADGTYTQADIDVLNTRLSQLNTRLQNDL